MSEQPPTAPAMSLMERAFRRVWLALTVALFYVQTAVLATLSRIVPGRRIHFLMRAMCRSTLKFAGIRLRVRGAENLPKSGGFLLVCNHVNMFDPLIVYAIVPRHCIAIEKAAHFKAPFYGRMISAWGNLPVEAGNHELSRRSMSLAAQALHEGTPVFIFPEGTRSGSGRLGPFKTGAFHLALEARVPVVPIVFKGAGRIFANGIVLPGVEEVVILPPIPLDGFGDHDHDLLSSHLRALIEAQLQD